MRNSLLLGSALALAFTAPSPVSGKPVVVRGTPTPVITTYATGFNNPRGLKFGPDGMLYVAEGGTGGGNSTVGQCEQVPAPVGPYSGAATGGRISRVDSNGVRTTVTDQFPSSQTSENLVSGVADVAFIGDTLYAITAGSGCSHGVPNTDNGIFRVGGDGSITLVADLSAFQKAHPVAHPEADDFEPDGTWYSMVPAFGALYAVEPNHGEVDRILPNGTITRIADISATQGHIVPTAIAFHSGAFYVGNLGGFPIAPGSEKILLMTRAGAVVPVASGLTTVVGVEFDSRGRMYVLENSVNAGFPTPGNGMIVRLSGARQEIIASGLALPTAMTFGPDGALYVTNWGFGPPPSLPNGPGEVLRITVPN